MSGATQAAWAERLMAAFGAAGLRLVVASPGARSTPLLLAAERIADLTVETIVDERCAGFFALGAARATGRPALLLCTSGTAGAHYLPAVLEARAARVPLIVLTADRPPERHRRGAAQTLDQSKLFGHAPLAFLELGAAQAAPEPLAGIERTAALALALASGPPPGPVHLNAWLRKPLEPPRDPGPPPKVAAPRYAPARLAPDPDAVDQLADAWCAATRRLLVAGPAPLAAETLATDLVRLAAASPCLLAAETASQLRHHPERPRLPALDHLEWLATPDGPLDRVPPDLVLQLGPAPTGRQTLAWLGRTPASRAVLADHWADPLNRAAALVEADPAVGLRALVEATARRRPAPADSAWLGALRDADARAARAVAGALAGGGALGEAEAVAAAIEAVPEGALLAVGNSLPIRLADLAAPGLARRVGVLHQRGAAGIDGFVSGAAGASQAAGRPLVGICGDLTLLHDAGGLACLDPEGLPIAIVVIANRGGRLFEWLPLAEREEFAAVQERRFVCPPRVDFAALAAAFGVEHARAGRPDELAAGLARALEHPGATLIEAVVEPHSARRFLGEAGRRLAHPG